MNEDIKDDVLNLIEQVLQYGVLVVDVTDERIDTVIDTLCQLAAVMKNEDGIEMSMKRGRPEIDIGEEQLLYLLVQGFRTKDISTMFGCSRTIECRMKKYERFHLNSMSVSDAHLDSLVREITFLFP